ncbi:hypothetical protein LUZ60_007743 [Juncus effusus]|nr:hypothetical protein LUZ60_007743 [Juncus effusus]
MGSNGARKALTFEGINVYLSRNLVAPELYDALHDALRLNGATVYTICDPDRNSPLDYHVISSPNHEKFANLKSRGCCLLGPQCVFFCAKEHRTFPKKDYTCCLTMDGVKVITSGFEKDEKAVIEERVTAMGGILLKDATLDANFVIMKNVLASKYQWALNVLKKPIVTKSWLDQCWTEHRLVPQEPHRILPFTGLIICVTKIPLGDKYLVARKWGMHIVNRRWIDQSIIKRARLDEASFPVTNNPPCSKNGITISSQKEKQQKHQNPNTTASWTPQPSQSQQTATSAELAGPTQSQNGSVSVPNTLQDAPKEKREGDEVATCDSRVAEDSDNDDLYLSEIRVSFVGFEEKEMERLVGLVRRGGGTRFVGLSEKLTHIVVGSPSEMEKAEVRRLAVCGVINVVRAAWLEECDKRKREVLVSPLHSASDLISSKDSGLGKSTDNCTTNGVKSSQGDKESLLDKRKGKSQSENNYTKAPGILEFGSKPENPTQSNGSSNNKSGSKPTQTCSKDSDLFKNSNTFKGKIFCFSPSFPLDRRAEILGWVRKGGGIIVEDPKRIKVHYIITCHGISNNDINSPISTIVSTQWIHSSLQEGSLQDVKGHIIYSPLKCRVPLPGFENFKFCFSQYEERERLLLKNLCFILGAKSTDRFTKKVTHLLCKFASGPKYEASCKLGVQAVTSDWISECVRKDMVVSLDEFRPRNVTTQEKEEGLCAVTQFPTQANRILLSQTQLTNCSKDNPEESNQEEIESFGTVCKKSKIEVSKDPSDVADVAEAIEDLLAQSSKIQDVKMAEQPAFERNVFTSDHSVLGKDHENPQSILTISRHWLNKAQTQESTNEPIMGRLTDQSRNPTYDAFSETQTDSQVVGYEEDLSGRQKIIDRVRSQSTTLTPSNELPSVV